MKRRIALTATIALFATTAQASHTIKQDADGCWNGRQSTGTKSCITVQKHDWSDKAIIVTYKNVCEDRIFVRSCHTKSSGGTECRRYGIRAGGTAQHGTLNATGNVEYRAVGSLKPTKDYTCANRWNMERKGS